MIDELPLAEGKKKFRNWAKWIKKDLSSLQWTFQHDSKSVLTRISFSLNICCLQNMSYSFPQVPFEPAFHVAWKDARLCLLAFQGFTWFTSMTVEDFGWHLVETLFPSVTGGSDIWNFESLVLHFCISIGFFPGLFCFLIPKIPKSILPKTGKHSTGK